jgi:ATP-dependent RNA helicase SUPV3L1/SUV3
MCNLSRPVDVVVIDEAHLLEDADRGWAWTQAIVGVPAKEIHVTGSQDALPFINRIAQICGDDLEVRTYNRKVPLRPMDQPISLQDVRAGDAVIAFTRADVLKLRNRLMQMGLNVATIYGALGPEIRRSEARRFRSGEADVLVATDAIGLGLNLPIDRVIFSALDKYDGKSKRPLTFAEIKQIGGRAGRFGLKTMGWVGTIDPIPLKRVAGAISSAPNNPDDTRLIVSPPWSAIELVSESFNTDNLAEILTYVSKELIAQSPQLKAASLEVSLQVCQIVRKSGLSLRDQYRYLGCPIILKNVDFVQELKGWAKTHGEGGVVHAPKCRVMETPSTPDEMEKCEDLLNRITVYSWLAMRWPEAYPYIEQVASTRLKVNNLIENALANRIARHAKLDRTSHAAPRNLKPNMWLNSRANS